MLWKKCRGVSRDDRYEQRRACNTDKGNQGAGLIKQMFDVIKQMFNVLACAVDVAHLRCESGPGLCYPRRKSKEVCKRSMSKCLPS